jgi:hypothetical protein
MTAAAFDAAFNSDCRAIYVPAGDYVLSGNTGATAPNTNPNVRLLRIDKALILFGDGPQATRIVWTPGTEAISQYLIAWHSSSAANVPAPLDMHTPRV